MPTRGEDTRLRSPSSGALAWAATRGQVSAGGSRPGRASITAPISSALTATFVIEPVLRCFASSRSAKKATSATPSGAQRARAR